MDSLRAGHLESTASLLAKVRGGDAAARERLLARYLPAFRRWAHGRLPRSARRLADTDDLVQATLVRALKHLNRFEPQHEGAFLAYLRKILLNKIRDEIRGARRRPAPGSLPDDLRDGARDPLDDLVWKETREAYEAALEQLTEMQREAFILRMELGFSHVDVAEAIGAPTPAAARAHVARAMVRLAEAMRDSRAGGVRDGRRA